MSLSKITAEERATHFRKDSIIYNLNIIIQPDQYFGLAELSFYL